MQTNNSQNEEGTLRLMTPGEIAMARHIFGESIVYNRVWIHCDSYFPFGLQSTEYAMSTNGELWYRKEKYHPDFSRANVSLADKHTFIHELGNVWQHQHGQWVRMRGLVSWAADYDYTLDNETLTDYSLEQQASIIADYWLLRVYGFDSWHVFQSGLKKNEGKYLGNESYRDIPHLYKKIVMGRS